MDTARRYHDWAARIARARRAEEDDPIPSIGPVWDHCLDCAAYLAAPSEMKPVPLVEALL